MTNGTGLSPPSDDIPNRIEALKRFWIDLGMSGDAGCTTWDVLDSLSDRVMHFLRDPPDVLSAESATAEAMLRIAGQIND